MKQSVCSAQINKRTEVRNIFNGSLYDIARLNSLKKLFLHCFLFLDNQLLAVADDAAASRIKLDDYKFNFLIQIFAKVFFVGIRYKASRNEHSRAVYQDAQSAVQDPHNLCRQNLVVIESLLQLLVAFLCSQSLIGKNNLTVSVVHLEDLNLHGVAFFGNRGKIYG